MHPEIDIFYSFGSHRREDVQQVPRIKSYVVSFFTARPRSRNVFIQEDATGSQDTNKLIKKALEAGSTYMEAGPIAAFQRKGKSPTSSQLAEINAVYLRSSPFSAAVRGMLDEIKSDGHIFEFESEGYPTPVAHQLRSTYQSRLLLLDQIAHAVPEEDLDRTERLYRQYLVSFVVDMGIRHRGLNGTIREYMQWSHKKQQSIGIFVRMGSRHDNLPNLVERSKPKGWPKLNTTVQYDDPEVVNHPEKVVMSKMENDLRYTPSKIEVVDTLHKQLFLTVLESTGYSIARALQELAQIPPGAITQRIMERTANLGSTLAS